MQLGITTFGEVTPDRHGCYSGGYARRLRELVEEAELADQVGLDVFGVGERHHPEYTVSAPAVVLAAAAARTKRIRLTSAATVLSTDDPVRVFQDFATLDLLSGGRAEIMAGRGGLSTDSFPLFGFDRENGYDAIFSEKLALLLAIRNGVRVTWSGEYRPAIDGIGIYPRPVQKTLPVWIAVAGMPSSAEEAGTLGLPITLAVISRPAEKFTQVVGCYREAASRAGHPPDETPIAVCTRGYLAVRPPRAETLASSPQQTIDLILAQRRMLGHERHLIHVDIATLSHRQILRTIELFGTRVAPVVRRETA